MFDLVVVAVSLVALAVENVPGLRRDIQKQFLRNLFPTIGRDISRDLTFLNDGGTNFCTCIALIAQFAPHARVARHFGPIAADFTS